LSSPSTAVIRAHASLGRALGRRGALDPVQPYR